MKLLDTEVSTADELADLYRRRWQMKLHIRILKTHRQDEVFALQESGDGG